MNNISAFKPLIPPSHHTSISPLLSLSLYHPLLLRIESPYFLLFLLLTKSETPLLYGAGLPRGPSVMVCEYPASRPSSRKFLP